MVIRWAEKKKKKVRIFVIVPKPRPLPAERTTLEKSNNFSGLNTGL